MLKVKFYMREACKLCDEAYVLLEILQSKYPFQIEEINIELNDEWLEKYQVIIPVIKIGDIILNNNMIDMEKIDEGLSKYLHELT